ncbi:YdiU family protein [Rhizobium sp. KVB221]|uniref:Protein nucleotidyltransferase YdiU n=1 Tax=Rhizobium setariae TaxID=2801340 RepID=A0A937CNW3_9HYPH|nr:YdiU family protein [Rhizobium setariae]MBL0371137.1 YdiU family protein [Rhizobium setariae]
MLGLSHSYSTLPERFFAQVLPSRVADPRMIKYNRQLAAELGPDWAALDDTQAAAILAGNEVPEGAKPISMAYAGHQFGSFVPQLGDGRAILLGEVVDTKGVRLDVQLKGAGRTPYSRGGDGRAALGPVLREYLVSEAMHAMGIPTTRALAAVMTGDPVYREMPLPGAVLTRVARSHVRVGTFQFFAARGDTEGLKALADYVIDRLYPEIKGTKNPSLALLVAVATRQAQLVAQWLHIGFIHGVMNTDNSSISGETIDFGPCAFMEAYNPTTVFSSIDRGGRYAYQNQPGIAQWNMARLAETLLPLIDADIDKSVESANQAVIAFAETFNTSWLAGMRRKLGLRTTEDEDKALIDAFLNVQLVNRADFTLAFRRLSDAAEGPEFEGAFLALMNEDRASAKNWLASWRARLSRETMSGEARARAMHATNPIYIPRNHLIEEAIQSATQGADFSPFETLDTVLSHPFREDPDVPVRYTLPAEPNERVLQTFCGT